MEMDGWTARACVLGWASVCVQERLGERRVCRVWGRFVVYVAIRWMDGCMAAVAICVIRC